MIAHYAYQIAENLIKAVEILWFRGGAYEKLSLNQEELRRLSGQKTVK